MKNSDLLQHQFRPVPQYKQKLWVSMDPSAIICALLNHLILKDRMSLYLQ